MLQPKRTRFNKTFKYFKKSKTSPILNHPLFMHGSFSIISNANARLNSRLIEACRRKLTFALNRQGRVWTRIFPDIPMTRKPAEVRMGKGKGSVKFYDANVSPGQSLFEIEGISHAQAKFAFDKMRKKLGFPILLKSYDSF